MTADTRPKAMQAAMKGTADLMEQIAGVGDREQPSLLIKEPDWVDMTNIQGPHIKLSEWFKVNVDPVNKMLSAGVEVYSDGCKYVWQKHERHDCKAHKALLINIQPSKKETREEKLEAVLKEILVYNSELAYKSPVFDRAKALLEDK